MENPQPSKTDFDDGTATMLAHLLLALFGLLAPLFTYFIAVSSITPELKVAGLSSLAVAYALICGWSFLKFRATRMNVQQDRVRYELPETEADLDAFDDAHAFFGNSLEPADMFRLVSSRVNAIVPHKASMLLVPDVGGELFQIKESESNDEIVLRSSVLPLDAGVSGLAYHGGEVEIDPDEERIGEYVIEDAGGLITAAAAIPLIHDDAIFGIFMIFLKEIPGDLNVTKLSLTNIGARIAPLFLGSFSFERSLSNALTDPLTGLPNERAFFMVLENQLAESHRFRDERPLSVMTADVRGFDEINRDLGHAVGDKVLLFVSAGLRQQLRKMDFLARSTNDEFLIILPTATEATLSDILGRILEHFSVSEFAIDEVQSIKISLNFGTATFWTDGETAKQLLGHANLRKTQSKSEEPDNVFWFPKEYVN